MANAPSTPPEIESNHPEPRGLYDASTERFWPKEAVDRFVVGRIWGPYDYPETCVHLSLGFDGFASITEKELQYFWSALFNHTTILQYWSPRSHGDWEVEDVLEDIDSLMAEARRIHNAAMNSSAEVGED